MPATCLRSAARDATMWDMTPEETMRRDVETFDPRPLLA